MIAAITFAQYIVDRYWKDFGARIDEMKLHKLLYFAQRESLIQLGEPLFDVPFHAWRYGPVLVGVRKLLKVWGGFPDASDYSLPEKYYPVFDKVFSQYAGKDSWSLSRLSHGEYSWQNARKGLGPIDNCDRPMSIDDIRRDANRVKLRRYLLSLQTKP